MYYSKEEMKKEEIQQNGALKKERQVLLICNDADICKKLASSIDYICGFETQSAEEERKALEMIEKSPWKYDVVVIYDDLKRKFSSLEVLRQIKKNGPEMEVIFVIASTEKGAYSALYEIAFSCFFHPINYMGIAYAVKFARKHAQSRRERKMLEKLQELSVAINSATELQDIQNLACQAAVEILNVDHSGLVQFGKDLSKGRVIAEYPETENFIGIVIQVKGIPVEQQLVYNNEIINIPDLSSRNDIGEIQSHFTKLNIRSLLIVPVILNNRVIASISLDMIKKNRVFYPDEIELCKKLANQVAVAIGKARYLRELQILIKIALDCGANVPMDPKIMDSEIKEKIKDMLEIVRKHAGSLLDVKNFFIAIYDEERDEYDFVYHKDEKDDVTEFSQEKRRKGLTAYVRRIQKAVRFNSDDLQNLINKDEIELVGELPKIWLGVPLMARGKVLGVMAVQNYENENAYDGHDLTVLQIIASQTAIAIDNCHLFQKSQYQLTEIETLFEASQEIAAEAMNVKSIFNKILEKARQLTNADSAQILFRDEAKNHFKVVFTHGMDELKGITFEQDEGLTSKVFEEEKYYYTGDYHNHPNKVKKLGDPKYRDLINSLATMPLKWRGEMLGAISWTSKNYNNFKKEDINLLKRFSGAAGTAIAIAREISFRQALLNNNPDAILAVDRKGIIKEFNKAAEQILEYTPDEILNKSVIDLWGSLDEARRIKQLMREGKNGGVSRIEVFAKNKRKENIPVLFSGSILYGEDYGENREEIGSIGHIEDQRFVSLKGRVRKLFDAIE